MSVDTSHGNSNMDYAEHTRTYKRFLSISIYLIVFVVLLLAGMKYFLV